MTAIRSAPPSFSGYVARRRRSTLISLTPLIDVVFILLLFFMLAYSFSDLHAIQLDAPARAGHGASIEGALLVEVRSDGVRFAGRYVSTPELIAHVQRARVGHPGRRVLVRSGNGVTLQDTVRVLDALAGAGVTHIALMDDPAASGAGKR